MQPGYDANGCDVLKWAGICAKVLGDTPGSHYKLKWWAGLACRIEGSQNLSRGKGPTIAPAKLNQPSGGPAAQIIAVAPALAFEILVLFLDRLPFGGIFEMR